ncbi:MAG: hypothetical protein WKF34_04470 [Pyrinomonadaceae bacterium]
MRLAKSVSVCFLILCLALTSIGQTIVTVPDADAAKKQKEIDELVVGLLERTLSEGSGLKSSTNRAAVYNMVGDMYWRFDPKRARELFRGVGVELRNYNAEAEADRAKWVNTSFLVDPSDAYDVRYQVIPVIANRDVELALEILFQTRSAALLEALAGAGQPSGVDSSRMYAYDRTAMTAQHEISLEQSFVARIAEKNPEALIKVIRDSLAQTPNANLVALLQRVHKNDPGKAAELGVEALRRVGDAGMATNSFQMRVALAYLQHSLKPVDSKEKPFVLPAAEIRELAGKLAAALLGQARSLGGDSFIAEALSAIERIAPERAIPIKQRLAENQRNMPVEYRDSQLQAKMRRGELTPEQMVAAIVKLPIERLRSEWYYQLSNQILRLNDAGRAKRLIDRIPDQNARVLIQGQWDARIIAMSSTSSSIDAAKRMISALTDPTQQVQRLVGLALAYWSNGKPADIQTAKELMADARLIAGEAPENEDDMARLMEVVNGYATIEPETAFRLFEGVVGDFNDIVAASATLSKFNKNDRGFRRGEIAMRPAGGPGWLLPFRFVPQIQTLGKADLERMTSITDRFTRNDMRIIMRIYALQGFLREAPKPPGKPIPVR